MRDVNKQYLLMQARNTYRFYLNYEGCKLYKTCIINPNSSVFYLNYEGCKLAICYHSLLSLSLFYLNYEGCKHKWPVNLYQDVLVLSEL